MPVRAPELETPLGWLNTDRPLRFDGELRGQVVVLDFWTYCCINCIHILPDLAWLEHKYAAEPVTFIGVHSAKFHNEANHQTIRAAILRYEIAHPVVTSLCLRPSQCHQRRLGDPPNRSKFSTNPCCSRLGHSAGYYVRADTSAPFVRAFFKIPDRLTME